MLFQTPELDDTENAVLASIEDTQRRLRSRLHQPRRWFGPLRRSVAAANVASSNAIEGFHVSRDDANAAVDGVEPFEATGSDWNAVHGYWDAMTYILQLAADEHFTYNDGVVRAIHYMMTKNDPRCRPGHYRPGAIYVHDGQDPVYEGPDARKVPELIEELIHHLSDTGKVVPAIVQAAMTHLNFVMIHPFKDGNGRMSRALQTLVLGREGTLDPHFSSIEGYLGRNTTAYYRVLNEVGGPVWNPQRDARPWLRFALRAHHHQATVFDHQITETDRLWSLLDQERIGAGMDERNMGSLYNAAMGFRVRRSDHIAYAAVSERVASSDLKKIVDLGFLVAVGERRGRYYRASDRLRQLRLAVRSERPPITDPFGPHHDLQRTDIPVISQPIR